VCIASRVDSSFEVVVPLDRVVTLPSRGSSYTCARFSFFSFVFYLATYYIVTALLLAVNPFSRRALHAHSCFVERIRAMRSNTSCHKIHKIFRRPCSDSSHVTMPYILSFYYYYYFTLAHRSCCLKTVQTALGVNVKNI